MHDYQRILSQATDQDIITKDQENEILSLFSHDSSPESNLVQNDRPDIINDSETPRFIRGFHDVLITFGILIVLAGIIFVTDWLFVAIGAWALAEIFVKRHRLALPAVVLTLVFTSSLYTYFFSIIGYTKTSTIPIQTYDWNAIFLICALPVTSAIFYWRFRVPIALAITIFTVLFYLFIVMFKLVQAITGIDDFSGNMPFISTMILSFLVSIQFIIALYFDVKDPHRKTTYSDIAFWLHLITSPLLLYAMVALLLGKNGNNLVWVIDSPSIVEASVVILCVLVMMLIGLILDRRAFVTSGLISFILAAYTIFESFDIDWGIDWGTMMGVILLIVGLIVLTFSFGWNFLRRHLLSIFPRSIVNSLPLTD